METAGPCRKTRIRRGLVATACFVALSAAFQSRDLGPDWLLSDGALLRATPLWGRAAADAQQRRALNHDYVRYFAPYATFMREELRAGRLPLWNPYVATGVPVAEALITTLFHPFTLVVAILPAEHALTMLALLRPALAGLGAFTFARVLGCGRAAAALAGVLFMLSPFHLGFRFHPQANVSGLLPFLLAVSELRLRGASLRRSVAAWSLAAAFMILGGHAETVVHGLALAWVYHLLRAAARGRHGLTGAAAFLASSTVLAVLGAAVVAWGHAEAVVGGATMHARRLFAGYPRLPLAHLVSFLVPSAPGTFLWPSYLGTVTLILAAGGARGPGRFPAWPWLLAGVLALLGAYGVWPVAPLLQSLPLLRVADNSRLTIVVHLALALLAARGLEALAAPPARRAMAGSALLLVFTLAVLADLRMLTRPDATRAAVLLALAAAVIALAPRIAPPSRWAWLVVAVVVADLYAARAPAARAGAGAFPSAPLVLARLADARGESRTFIPEALLPANIAMRYGVPAIGGYEPVMPERTVELLRGAGLRARLFGVEAPLVPRPEDLRLLSLLNVRHLLLWSPAEPPAPGALRAEVRSGQMTLYTNPAAFPRAFAVGQARVAGSRQEALQLVTDPDVDLRHAVVLEAPLPADRLPSSAASGAPSAVELLEYRPGRARMVVTCGAACYLVFSESFTSGWRATVDRLRAPVLCADYALVGVPVPPGRHEVAVRYLPLSLIVGGALSLVTTFALAVAALVPARAARLGSGSRLTSRAGTRSTESLAR